jgi:hypothetical protein
VPPNPLPPEDFSPHPDQARQAAIGERYMRRQTRETWLIPLLAVPISRIVLSPRCTDDFLTDFVIEGAPPTVRDRARRVAELTSDLAASPPGRALTAAEAGLLTECADNDRGLACAAILTGILVLPGLGLPADLPGDPLIRGVASWVASGAAATPMAALIATHVLYTLKTPGDLLPRATSRFAPVARAIDRRLAAEGVTTWEEALLLSHRFWSGGGWIEVAIWQGLALGSPRFETESLARVKEEKAERAAQVKQFQDEQHRLEMALLEAEAELRALRPLREKLAALREDAERLRVREAELVHARDRALARAEALERANDELTREHEDATRRLAELDPPDSTAEVETTVGAAPVLEAEPLPADLLAGRTVFFFTGVLRKSSADAAGESLGALGPADVRVFCLGKGSDGPDSYPPGSLVIVDIRFVGHSQSGMIAARAERSRAEYLAVRSGKGSLARTVAVSLRGPR